MATVDRTFPRPLSPLEESPDQLRAGIEAFTSMMRAIYELSDFLKPGCRAGEDYSTTFDLPAAVQVFEDSMASAPRAGFVLALVDYLQNQCGGVDIPFDDPESVLRAVMEFREWRPCVAWQRAAQEALSEGRPFSGMPGTQESTGSLQ